MCRQVPRIPGIRGHRPCVLLPALLLLLAWGATGCGLSRVDPISPDIHGVHLTPPSGLGQERYYYERKAPQTGKWYEAEELIPGYGLMVYTKDGAARLEYDTRDNKP